VGKCAEELLFVVEESPEGGYVAKALGPSIVTEADDWESLKKQVTDAVLCHFEDPSSRPRIIRLHTVKDELLAL
jgi:hypothetical protein